MSMTGINYQRLSIAAVHDRYVQQRSIACNSVNPEPFTLLYCLYGLVLPPPDYPVGSKSAFGFANNCQQLPFSSLKPYTLQSSVPMVI